MQQLLHQEGPRNYAGLNEISKAGNYLLGDRTGRSICMRTGHGFKNLFRISDKTLSDNRAEDIVHFGMIAILLGLSSKNTYRTLCQLFAVTIIALLFFCFQSGSNPSEQWKENKRNGLLG